MAAIVATEYFPFDGTGDRATESRYRFLAKYCWGRDSGVLNKGLLLEPYGDSTGMQVKVHSGEMWLDSAYGRFDTNPMILTIGSAAGVGSGQRRIDRVVARTDWVNNRVELDVKAGTVATIASAVPPTLTQTVDGVWEQSLAQVWIGNGVATITAANVIDERTFARNPTGVKVGDYKWTAIDNAAGYLPCDGAAVSRVTYAELFAQISTFYGVGDGSTTFNVPDKRGEVLAFKDASAVRFTGFTQHDVHYGEQNHTLTAAEQAIHFHTLAHTHPINHDHPSFSLAGRAAAGDGATSVKMGTTADSSVAVDIPNFTGTSGAESTSNTTNAGSGAAHNNVQPTGMAWLWIAARPT